MLSRDDVAPVAYLKLCELHLEQKTALQTPLPPAPETEVSQCLPVLVVCFCVSGVSLC